MPEEGCSFAGDCAFRGRCACGGHAGNFCKTSSKFGGLVFVEQSPHPNCIAKSYFGGGHICLCPAISEKTIP